MYPKQFIPFLDGSAGSLLGATLRRLPQEAGFELPTILCNNDHRFLVQNELEGAGIAAQRVILEPVARNTAPAIAVAALSVAAVDADAVLVVMPSDHAIKGAARFMAAVRNASAIAASGKLVLFGITPKTPHTGYGYIRRGGMLPGFETQAFDVDGFFEKPDRVTAERYLEDGGYVWNSGIFVLHVRTFLNELERLQPDILATARAALEGAGEDLGFLRLDQAAFSQCEDISVDYAIMEKTGAAIVLPFDSDWSDVGSWSSLWELAEHDGDGNAVQGDTLLEDVRNCYVHAERGMVAGLGLENLIIIDTPDVTLVADRRRAQDVGQIVTRLKASGRREHESHVRNYRPWGFFETLNLGERFQVKLLHV